MTQTKLLMKRLATLLIVPILLAGCASGPKANLPANANPNDEVARMRTDIANGEANDFAILDQKDFNDSRDHLAKAEDKLKNNKSQEDVLDELRYSRGSYERAEKMANERRSHVETILDTRSQAISAGALKYPQSRKELDKVDQDARDLAESSDIPAADKVSKIQQRYGDVQLTALEADQLGDAKATIDAAKEQNAESKAPKTLNQAKVDYENAKNAISMNRSNSAAYMPAVKTARLSSDTLARVMEMARKGDKNFNENEAVRIVWQDRAIHSLGNVVNDQEAQKAAMQDKLSATRDDLKMSSKKVALQKALQSAQDEFSADEAEVYQKDNSLLIRLKSIGFASGSAKVPNKSDELLSKVQTIVEGLKPESVVIQGHTDSVGAKATNEKLSEKRAQEVASYFEKNGLDQSMIKTEGYGDSKPLSTNKTKEGRAENRRIDIVVTPSEQM